MSHEFPPSPIHTHTHTHRRLAQSPVSRCHAVVVMRWQMRHDIETTSANFAQPAHDQPATGVREVIPVAVECGIPQECKRRLEAHLGERRNVAPETHAVEGRETSVARHVVCDEVEVAIVNVDAMATENSGQLTDNIAARSLNTIDFEHTGNVVGRDLVGIDKVAIFLHSSQIHTLSVNDNPVFVILVFLADTSSNTCNLLNDSLLDSALDEVEHENLGHLLPVELEGKRAPLPVFLVA